MNRVENCKICLKKYPNLCVIFVLLCWTNGADAENRVALIIGNGAYQNVPRLANPGNDSVDMTCQA